MASTENTENTENQPESTHRLIEGRLEKMEELGKSVELYPYSYDRTHTSVQARAAEAELLELGFDPVHYEGVAWIEKEAHDG